MAFLVKKQLFEIQQVVPSVRWTIHCWNWTVHILTNGKSNKIWGSTCLTWRCPPQCDKSVSAKNIGQRYLPTNKLKTRGSQLLHTFLIAVQLLQQRQQRDSSCLLLASAGTESWFPGDTPYPQAGPGASLLLPSRFVEERAGAQTLSSCLSLWAAELGASSQAWLVPGVKEISTALCLLVCWTSWEPPHLGAAFQFIPAPQAKVGAGSLGPRGPVSCASWGLASGSAHASQAQWLCWPRETQPGWNSHF